MTSRTQLTEREDSGAVESQPSPAHHSRSPLAATLVAIASAGHSGSTLLDLLLGNHPQVSSAGEMNRLSLHAPDRVCACGATVTQCEYWNEVRAAIGRQRNRPGVLRWDECHTDLPPQKPILKLEGLTTPLVDGQPLPAGLRQRLIAAGLNVSDAAVVTRGGVRDFKWRLQDKSSRHGYVLRVDEDRLEVYGETFTWKNPIRLVPQPIELALAWGQPAALRLLGKWSSAAAAQVTMAENSWAVADAMATVKGTPFVVDSSKSPLRLKLLYMQRPERVRVVELVRDGRAVAASAMRRRDMSARMAARVWKRDNQNLAVMLRSVPAHRKTRVHYEDLCEDPARELDRLCAFLGLTFDARMLTLWQRPVHNIPGNPMLFKRSHRTISKDERWRQDLSNEDLRAFARVAGRVNQSFGYR